MKRTLLIAALMCAGAVSTAGAAGLCSPGLRPDTNNAIANQAASAVDGPVWVNTQYGERRGERRGRGGPDAVLFSNPDFRGERYVIDGEYVPNLANTGFNDRAQSLRVNRGYWIFCSDAQFQGRCRTFGPGDYPTLGWALDNKVSSGRRISDRYPYGGQPNWGDRR